MTLFKESEYRRRYNIEEGHCFCGMPATQMAHRLCQSKMFIKKYGEKMIHHNFNLVPTCGLEHNSTVNVSNRPQVERKLIKLIKTRRDDILTVRAINEIIGA